MKSVFSPFYMKMLQSENGMPSVPLWSIDRKINRQPSPSSKSSLNVSASPTFSSPLWDSTPIGKSLNLRLCQREQATPQLILEDKVFRSAIRLQHGSTYRSHIQFVGTLIVDDETQRLTYVVDRLQLLDSQTHEGNNLHPLSPNKHLNGEFLIPIRFESKTITGTNGNHNLIQDGIKVNLHRF